MQELYIKSQLNLNSHVCYRDCIPYHLEGEPYYKRNCLSCSRSFCSRNKLFKHLANYVSHIKEYDLRDTYLYNTFNS